MNLLIIDDDPDDTTLFCDAINDLYPLAHCSGVNSAADIQEVVARILPDIIFLDGHMFPVSGKECLLKLNSFIDRTRIKIVIHSGSLSPTEIDEFKEVGIDDILVKAPSYNQMLEDLKGIIKKYELPTLR